MALAKGYLDSVPKGSPAQQHMQMLSDLAASGHYNVQLHCRWGNLTLSSSGSKLTSRITGASNSGLESQAAREDIVGSHSKKCKTATDAQYL